MKTCECGWGELCACTIEGKKKAFAGAIECARKSLSVASIWRKYPFDPDCDLPKRHAQSIVRQYVERARDYVAYARQVRKELLTQVAGHGAFFGE